jgi:glycosyltransferase involved in cell wall biosynthesis
MCVIVFGQSESRASAAGGSTQYAERVCMNPHNRLRIAYVTTYDSGSVDHWSGTGYFIRKTLEQQAGEVHRIGPLEQYIDLELRVKARLRDRLSSKQYMIEREPKILRHYADQVARRLKDVPVEFIVSPGTIPIAYLECRQPVVFWTDATFAGMVNFYHGAWSNLSADTVRKGNQMEQAALSNCRLAVYSSEWAARTATSNYRVDPQKVKVVPFGANLEMPAGYGDVATLVQKRSTTPCRLLFVGVEWFRKGGDIAVALASELNRQGLKTELTVVGCTPEGDIPDFVVSKGFISKRTRDGLNALQELLTQAHFLVLPSRAECVAVVIAEANACGVPVIASNVGGMTTAIQDDMNGRTFDLENFVDQASRFIQSQVTAQNAYRELALSSFGEYENRLNWRVAGEKFRQLLEEAA